ncbi:phage major capsid protein [Aeromonas salmonicida]|uniref:phage major capsid protein n=1 Tax=Aeromonas salmonicida TaxID=645 RepID=UPI0038BA744F
MEQEIQAMIAAQTEQAAVIAGLQSEVLQLKSAPVIVDEVKEAKELKAKFYSMVKDGDGQNLVELVKDGKIKAAQMGTKGDTVIQDVNRNIVTRITETSVLTGLFGRETTQNDNYVRKVSVGGAQTYWDGEAKAEGAPELVEVKMSSGKVISLPVISNDIAADSFFDIEAFLMTEVAKAIGDKSAMAILNGDGLKKPKGFLKYFDKVEGIKALADRPVDMFPILEQGKGLESLIDALRKMTIDLPTPYRSRAKYAMSVAAFEKVSAEKDTQGHSFVQKDVNGAVAGRLNGYEIVVDRLLPADAPILFGDFESAFAVCELPNSVQMLRNAYVIPFHVQFNIGLRVGTIVKANDSVIGLFMTV